MTFDLNEIGRSSYEIYCDENNIKYIPLIDLPAKNKKALIDDMCSKMAQLSMQLTNGDNAYSSKQLCEINLEVIRLSHAIFYLRAFDINRHIIVTAV